MSGAARIVSIVLALLVLAIVGLRAVGLRDAGSVHEVTAHVNGRGGAADLALAATDARAADALSAAGGQACKPPGGFVKTLLDYRGPDAVVVNEVIPSGQSFRFRWDCRLHVLRMADQ